MENALPRIATVTVSFNEADKLAAWQGYYAVYAPEIALHIIVDDGSKTEYLNRVKAAFPSSIILTHKTNRGLIAGYNTGFRYALEAGATYIGTLGPDFRLLPNTIYEMCAALDADETLAGISPVTIKIGSSDEIESVGARLNVKKATLVPYDIAPRWLPTWAGVKIVDTMHGGFHLLRRATLEKIGLQDERLFMYGDEIDFGWRAKTAGLKFGVLLTQRAWHEHVNYGGKTRPPLAAYLVSRNRMLIMKRHGRPVDKLILLFGRLVTLLPAMLGYYRREGTLRHAWAYALGLWHGIWGATGRPPKSILSG